MVLEIGCGAYAPFARLCAEEGAKQVPLLQTSNSINLFKSLGMAVGQNLGYLFKG